MRVSEMGKIAILEASKPEKVHVALKHLARRQVGKARASHQRTSSAAQAKAYQSTAKNSPSQPTSGADRVKQC